MEARDSDRHRRVGRVLHVYYLGIKDFLVRDKVAEHPVVLQNVLFLV
jgi:hypothetical protein